MRVTLYAKSECELCDRARAQLEALQTEIPHQLVEVDIESEPTLEARFSERVPVVEVGPLAVDEPLLAPVSRPEAPRTPPYAGTPQ